MNKEAGVRWNLDSILKDEEFDSKLEASSRAIKKYFSKCKKELSPDMPGKKFKQMVKEFEKLLLDADDVLSYSHLYQSTNMNDNRTFYLLSKSNQLGLSLSEMSIFMSHWLKGLALPGMKKLDTKNSKRLFKERPDLEFYFEHLVESRKYSLSLAEEKIVSRKNSNLKSPIMRLRGMITNDFEYEVKLKGKKPIKINAQGKLTALVRHKDSEMRKAAYKALFTPFKKNINIFYTIYEALLKDWYDGVAIRGHKQPISIRNFTNYLDDKTVDTLMDVCVENRKVFQRYFKLKAKAQKIKKLSRYDLYAPVGSSSKKYTYESAKKEVLKVLKNFDKGFYERGKLIFDEKHVDSHPRQNKRSGAFCSTVSTKITPYVLLNFNGNADAMMTMAHEIGHGIHSLYSNKLSDLVAHSTLPLAETASTFSEMLMFDHLLKTIKDKKEKKAMLFEKVDSSFATIIRQNYFVKFEKAAHEMVQKGTNGEELSDKYYEILKEQFGNAVSIPKEFRYEWSYIPHIFVTPFYCYAYNFGELLSMALYSLYKKKGKSFIPSIEKILAAGGSQKPTLMLKEVGIDINSPEFWQGSFNIIEEWIEMIRELR